MPLNVLLITVDQLRGDCLSVLGHPIVKTPAFDALAAEGVMFTRHYSCAAPCGPSRATLLTGLYPMNHRAITNGTPLDPRHTNVALEARAAGYAPVLFGYTDTPADPRNLQPGDPLLTDPSSVLNGFDVGCGFDATGPQGWLDQLEAHGYRVEREPWWAVYLPEHCPPIEQAGFPMLPARYRAEHSDSAYMTDVVIDHLTHSAGDPWFIHAVYLRPHPPLVAPAPYHDMYDPADAPVPVRGPSRESEVAQHPYLQAWDALDGNRSHRVMVPNPAELGERDVRRMQASYFGLVSEVDAQVGRLLEHIRSSGGYDNTLVVLTCDHGELLGDHWQWGKGGFYDGSYHVPMIIRAPQGDRGRRVDDVFTEGVDVMPTILDYLGLDPPHTCDGTSLKAFVEGTPPSRWRKHTFWEFDFRSTDSHRSETALGLTPDQCTLNVIRDEHYKYVHFTALPPLLFDLQRDPGECHNVVGDPDYAAVALEYAGRLLGHRMLHAERTLTNHRITEAGPVHYTGART